MFQFHDGLIQTNALHFIFCKIILTQFHFHDGSIQAPFGAENSAKWFVFESNEGSIQTQFCITL